MLTLHKLHKYITKNTKSIWITTYINHIDILGFNAYAEPKKPLYQDYKMKLYIQQDIGYTFYIHDNIFERITISFGRLTYKINFIKYYTHNRKYIVEYKNPHRIINKQYTYEYHAKNYFTRIYYHNDMTTTREIDMYAPNDNLSFLLHYKENQLYKIEKIELHSMYSNLSTQTFIKV